MSDYERFTMSKNDKVGYDPDSMWLIEGKNQIIVEGMSLFSYQCRAWDRVKTQWTSVEWMGDDWQPPPGNSDWFPIFSVPSQLLSVQDCSGKIVLDQWELAQVTLGTTSNSGSFSFSEYLTFSCAEASRIQGGSNSHLLPHLLQLPKPSLGKE